MSTRVPAGPHDAPGRLDPVEHGHADVHQHDVGPEPARRRDRVLAVGRFADDAEVGLAVEDLAQPDADERLVVGDQDVVIGSGAARGRRSRRSAVRAGVEAAAVERDPLAHADQPVAAAHRGRGSRPGPSSAISSSSESAP